MSCDCGTYACPRGLNSSGSRNFGGPSIPGPRADRDSRVGATRVQWVGRRAQWVGPERRQEPRSRGGRGAAATGGSARQGDAYEERRANPSRPRPSARGPRPGRPVPSIRTRTAAGASPPSHS